MDIRLTYGNTHKIFPPKNPKRAYNCHRWTMFVKFEGIKISQNDLIEKVRFGLDPTFGMDFMDVKAGPDCKFEMTFTGFAPFGIPITITFRRGLLADRQMML